MAPGNGKQLHASEPASDFASWLPQPFSVQLILRRQHGQWYATAREYDVTGMGESPRDAAHEAVELLVAYLLAYYREGSAHEEALRPASVDMATRIESRFGTVLSSLLRGAGEKVPLPRRKRVSLPSLVDDRAQPVG